MQARVVLARCIFVHKNILPSLRPGVSLETRDPLNFLKERAMPRKKAANQNELFTFPVRTRITQKAFDNLEKIRKESDCQSVAEVARKILSKEKINCFYRDISLNAPMEEMALIRKELKAIGVNINQQTHRFHTSDTDTQRAFYVMKTADLYSKVGAKVDELLIIISKLAEKWLPGS